MPEEWGDKPRNPTRNQMEPGNDDATACQKTRETSPVTLLATRSNQEMTMEQNAKRLGRQPRTLPRTTRNQEMMMEQNAKRPGRQAPEPTQNQMEPGNDDGTACQKTRETSPGTLLATRSNQEMTMEQNAKRLGRQAPEPYPETRKS